MTNQEAVKILKSKMDGSVDTSYEWAETVRMAIEALKAPTKSTNTQTDTPTGFISKEDVKWQIQEWINELNEAIDMLDSIPSAEPLVLTCDGCRHVGTYDTDFPCSGCIRREKDYYEQER